MIAFSRIISLPYKFKHSCVHNLLIYKKDIKNALERFKLQHCRRLRCH